MNARLRKQLTSKKAAFSLLALAAILGKSYGTLELGVNLLGRDTTSANGTATISEDQYAGVVPQQDWNNLGNNSDGITGNFVYTGGVVTSTSGPLYVDNGVAGSRGTSAITATITANDSWSSDGTLTADPNTSLEKGIIKANGVGSVVTVTLNNLTPGANYNFLAYGQENGGNPDTDFNLTGAAAYSTYYVKESNTFDGTFTLGTSTDSANRTQNVDYVEWDSVNANSSGQLTMTMTYRGNGSDGAGLAGFQLIGANPVPGDSRYYKAGAGAGTFDYTSSNFAADDQGITTVKFVQNDVANFGDLGTAGERDITVDAAGVTPNSTTVDNNAADPYVFSGGPILGLGGLTKDGVGSLTLTGINQFTGGTTILHGTVNVSTIGDSFTAGNLGQGSTLTIGDTQGATDAVLNYTGATASVNRGVTMAATGGAIDIAPGAALTFASLTGSGPLTIGGGGSIAFTSTGFGAFSGSLTVPQGNFSIGHMSSGDAGTTATLGTAGPTAFTYTGPSLDDARAFTVGGSGATLTATDPGARYQVGSLTATGPVTVAGPGRVAVSGVASFTAFPTLQAGSTLELQNQSTTTPNVIPAGPINLTAGTLVVAQGALGSNTDAVNLAGGTLRLGQEGLNLNLYTQNYDPIGEFSGTSNNTRQYFNKLTPKASDTTAFDGHTNLDFTNAAYGAGAPFAPVDTDIDNIRASLTGKILITSGGDTTFYTTSDDGSALFIDGQRVVDNNQYQGATTRQGTINLTPGLHDIQILYYEGGGGAGLLVEYTPAGGTRQTIPNSVLYAGDAGTGVYTDPRPVNVTADSGLEAGGSANLGVLTQNAGTTLTTVGNLNFASTTLSGSGATYGLTTNALSIVNPGAISATGATINKAGNGALLFNVAPAGVTLNVSGGLVVTQGSDDGTSTTDPLAGTTINYNGGGIGFSASAGNPTYTESIVTGNNYQVEAGRFQSGIEATTTINWAPANNSVAVAAGQTATFGVDDSNYTLNISAPVAAAGNLVVNEGQVNFTGSSFSAGSLTVNLAEVNVTPSASVGDLSLTGTYAGAVGTSNLYVSGPYLTFASDVQSTSVTVSGSTLNVSGALTNSGALAVSAGNVNLNSATNGSITQTGGNLFVSSTLSSTGLTTVNAGTMTVSDTFTTGGLSVTGGNVTAYASVNSTAPVSVSGGTVRFGGPVSAPSVSTSGTGVLTLNGSTTTSSGVTVGVGSTLNLDMGSGVTQTMTGGVTVAQGTLHAVSGTTDLGAGALTVTPRTFTPGLLEGVIANTTVIDTTTPNPGIGHPGSSTGGFVLSPRMGETDVLDNNHWGDNETWVYTGQFYDADGKFTFAESIDDQVSVKIDGVEVLHNTAYNVATNTNSTTGLNQDGSAATGANTATPSSGNYGMGPNGDGWHTFEVRFMNGGGGAGTFTTQGWGGASSTDDANYLNKGFGLNSDITTDSSGGNYILPLDDGSGSLFRVTGGGGFVSIEAGATIAAGSTTGAQLITLTGASGTPATLKLNDAATATASNADVVSVAGGVDAEAVLDIGANGTMTVGEVVFSDGSSLEKQGAGTLIVSGSINGTSGPVTTAFVNSTFTVSNGTLLFNAPSNTDNGYGQVTATGATTTVGGIGTLPTLLVQQGATLAPGSNGVGVLTVAGDLSIDSTSALAMKISDVLSHDLVNVSGAVSLDNSKLQITLLPDFSDSVGDIFFLIVKDGTDPVTGTFLNDPNGATVTIGGVQFEISYTADSGTNSMSGGNDIALEALTAVPEPGALGSLIGGLSMLAGISRFRPRARR